VRSNCVAFYEGEIDSRWLQSGIKMGQVSKAAYGWNPAPKRDFSGAAYGVFYSTQTQPALAPDTPQIITLNTQNGSSGISLDNNKIVIAQPATYRMSVSILIQNTDNAQHDFVFWLKFIGNDYPNSGHKSTLQPRKNNGQPSFQTLAFDFIGTSLNPNDYVELYWKAQAISVSLVNTLGVGVPNAPSVSVNINRVA
jgi:hypothetical protein